MLPSLSRHPCLLVLVLFSLGLMTVGAQGATLTVDPDTGADTNDGVTAPLLTINRAIQLAQPGDTISLQPKVYHQIAAFREKHGTADQPITLEGNGATLEGSDPLDPAQWEEVSPGLFACEQLIPVLNPSITGRWFFLFDGQMNRMGRTSKGKSVGFKPVEELLDGEWTFIENNPPALDQPRLSSTPLQGCFYIKLPAGQDLAAANIRVPLRSNGVQLSGTNSHLIIRNITATHPYNDGFNIHGHCENVRFENIRAVECGDDGVSAHGTASYHVDGLISVGNSTGITDTVQAITRYNHVFITDNVGFDLYFLDEGRYSVTNAVILSTAQYPLSVVGKQPGGVRLDLKNVYIKRMGAPASGHFTPYAQVSATRCTLENLNMPENAPVAWHDSIIAGVTSEPSATGADLNALISTLVPEAWRKHFAAP